MTREGTEENYNIFRWYRDGWGRYTQSDPLRLRVGSNLYDYRERLSPFGYEQRRETISWTSGQFTHLLMRTRDYAAVSRREPTGARRSVAGL
jgi:hypothetical protein